MRNLAIILFVLNFTMTPIASGLAMALGFSGEHVHYDPHQHADVGVSQTAEVPHSHSDVSSDVELQSASDVTVTADHEHEGGLNKQAHGSNTPIKHSHGEAHSAVFIAANTAVVTLPAFTSTATPLPPSFPTQKHTYPPFRPPQRV